MEILSDATFKGNVSIEGTTGVKELRFVYPNGYSYAYITGSEFSLIEDSIHGDINSLRVSKTFNVNNNVNVGSNTVSACVLSTNYIRPFETTPNGPIEIYSSSGDHYGLHKPSCISVDFSANKTKGLGICMSGKTVYIPIKEGTVALTSDIPSLSDYQKKFTTFSSPSIPANCTAFEFTGTAISDANKTHIIQVQNTSTGKSVIAETWMTTNKKPAMSFAGCTSTVAAGTYTAIVL